MPPTLRPSQVFLDGLSPAAARKVVSMSSCAPMSLMTVPA